MKTKRGDAEIDFLAKLIIAVAFLVLGFLIYLGLTGKLSDIGDFLKDFLGLGR